MAGDVQPMWTQDATGPLLHAMRCRACCRTFFPPQRYGCESCGATGDELESVDVPTDGAVRSFAVVHVHPARPTPYTIGEIALDAGPVVLGVLEADGPVIGQRVQAAVASDGVLRFEVVSS